MDTRSTRFAKLTQMWVAGLSALCLVQLALPGQASGALPPELLQQWESRAETYGKQHCQALQAAADEVADGSQVSDLWGFDAARVYYQMANYSRDGKFIGDSITWKACMDAAEKLYRDKYVLPNDGSIPGVAVYSRGLAVDTDPASEDAVVKLAENSEFGLNGWIDPSTQDYNQALGTSQTLLAMVDYLKVTKPAVKPARYDSLLNAAFKHLDQWFVQKIWMEDGFDPLRIEAVGMTLQALIEAYSYGVSVNQPDSRIPEKIKMALDGLWAIAWRQNEKAFFEDSRWPFQGAPTFNLLIAPAYAWYYQHTVDTGQEDLTYRDKADLIFEGGVVAGQLDSPSYFNQNYIWSFKYVALRQPAPAPQPEPEPGPVPPPVANHPPVCKNAKATPSVIWPPNNKYVLVQLYDVTDEDPGDEVTVMYHQPLPKGARYVEETGKLYLRAQLHSNKPIHEYVLPFTARDLKGESCTGQVTVKVVLSKKKWKHLKHRGDRWFDRDDDDRRKGRGHKDRDDHDHWKGRGHKDRDDDRDRDRRHDHKHRGR